jgi:hypothetical protein
MSVSVLLQSLLLFATTVLVTAREPTCAVLFCDAQNATRAWLDAAQTEMLLVTQSLFGGFLENGERRGGCGVELLDSTVCFDACSLTEKCHTANCDWRRHRELFEHSVDRCCPVEDDDDRADCECRSVCHRLRKWIDLGIEKLYIAYDLFDAGQFNKSTSFACAAERLLSFSYKQFEKADAAFPRRGTYRHIVGASTNVSFAVGPLLDDSTSELLVATRPTQSFQGDEHGRHTMVANYLLAFVLNGTVEKGAVQQLLWPVGGLMPSFDRSSLPQNNECARSGAPTTVMPAFNVSTRLDGVGPHDFAAVVDSVVRCDGFPPPGKTRYYDDLTPSSCCSALVLIADIEVAKHDNSVSLAYIAFRKSRVTFEANETRAMNVVLYARLAEPGTCIDFAANTTTGADNDTIVLEAESRPVHVGAPRCVGGRNEGALCTRRSECGAGLACRTNPLTHKPLCYDGTWWNEAMPCSVESEECPYGDCVGV